MALTTPGGSSIVLVLAHVSCCYPLLMPPGMHTSTAINCRVVCSPSREALHLSCYCETRLFVAASGLHLHNVDCGCRKQQLHRIVPRKSPCTKGLQLPTA